MIAETPQLKSNIPSTRMPSEGQTFTILEKKFEVKKSRGTIMHCHCIDKKFSVRKLIHAKFKLRGTMFKITSTDQKRNIIEVSAQ